MWTVLTQYFFYSYDTVPNCTVPIEYSTLQFWYSIVRYSSNTHRPSQFWYSTVLYSSDTYRTLQFSYSTVLYNSDTVPSLQFWYSTVLYSSDTVPYFTVLIQYRILQFWYSTELYVQYWYSNVFYHSSDTVLYSSAQNKRQDLVL